MQLKRYTIESYDNPKVEMCSLNKSVKAKKSTKELMEFFIKKSIKYVLEEEYYLYLSKEGYYDYDLDYDDNLEDSSVIKEFLSTVNSLQEAKDTLFDAHLDTIFNLEGTICTSVEIDLLNYGIDYDEYNEIIRDYLFDVLSINAPIDDYLGLKLPVNLILDTGDGNVDFTLNNNFVNNNINEKSSILWLAKQQGYSKKQLEEALFEDKHIDSDLLKSIFFETLNCTSNMNALTFFITMSVKDIILMKGSLEGNFIDKESTFITIPKNTNCGLIDYWSGAGSTLEIKLEKDVVVPLSIIDSCTLDGIRGHEVGDMYGLYNDFWETHVEYELPPIMLPPAI